MQFYLDILILFVRVAVFIALVGFFLTYIGQKSGDRSVKRVRRLLLALIASDALLYANLIYGKLSTLLGGSLRDVPDLVLIFSANILAGTLALWALRGMYRMEKHG